MGWMDGVDVSKDTIAMKKTLSGKEFACGFHVRNRCMHTKLLLRISIVGNSGALLRVAGNVGRKKEHIIFVDPRHFYSCACILDLSEAPAIDPTPHKSDYILVSAISLPANATKAWLDNGYLSFSFTQLGICIPITYE